MKVSEFMTLCKRDFQVSVFSLSEKTVVYKGNVSDIPEKFHTNRIFSLGQTAEQLLELYIQAFI